MSKQRKVYTVMIAPTENVYNDEQLCRSIFDSLFSVMHSDESELCKTFVEDDEKELAVA